MKWREQLNARIKHWPQKEQTKLLTEVGEENRIAELHGFTCQIDDRREIGKCLFQKGIVRVWLSPDGWCRAVAPGIIDMYVDHRYYHTLAQALIDEHPRAIRNEYGQLQPIPLTRV